MWTIAFLVLFTFFVLVFCIPLKMDFRVDIDGRAKSRLKFLWLYGLLKWDTEKRGKPARKKKRRKEKRKRVKKPGKWKDAAGTAAGVLRTEDLFRQGRILLGRILGSFNIGGIDGDLLVGLDDPADTGFLYGLAWPAVYSLNSINGWQVCIQPEFGEGPVCRGQLAGTVSMRPVLVILAVLRFLFSRAVLKAGWIIASQSWKRKFKQKKR